MLEKVFLLMKVKGSIRIGAMPSFFWVLRYLSAPSLKQTRKIE